MENIIENFLRENKNSALVLGDMQLEFSPRFSQWKVSGMEGQVCETDDLSFALNTMLNQ